MRNKQLIYWETGFAIVYVLAIYLVFFYFNPWFNSTLNRHVGFQYPLLIALGFIGGRYGLEKFIGTKNLYIQLSVLLLFIGTMVFWILPVSVDAAALDSTVDFWLSITLWFASLMLGSQFRQISAEIRFAFLFMQAAMVFANGTLLKKIDLLLCGAYTLQQQKVLAEYLMIAGVVILLFSFVYLGVTMKRDSNYEDALLKSANT